MQVHIALGWSQSTTLPGEGEAIADALSNAFLWHRTFTRHGCVQVLSCHIPLEGLDGRTVRLRVAAGAAVALAPEMVHNASS